MRGAARRGARKRGKELITRAEYTHQHRPLFVQGLHRGDCVRDVYRLAGTCINKEEKIKVDEVKVKTNRI